MAKVKSNYKQRQAAYERAAREPWKDWQQADWQLAKREIASQVQRVNRGDLY